MSYSGPNPVLGFYQNFALEQLNKWNEVNEMVERLKKTDRQPNVDLKIKETIDKLRTTSELNIHDVKANLQKVQGMSRNPSKSSLSKKKPVKPALTLDIKEINKKFNETNHELKKLTNISNNHSRSIEGQILTPSQSQSHRKSIEKWIFPDAQKAAKSNIDLARAILIDPEASRHSNMSSQKFNSIHEIK